MLFPDYGQTGKVYHIVSITDLEKTLKDGINYDDKVTYTTKYDGFHQLIDKERPAWIPDWVVRSKVIFASMNYPKTHQFHSHTAILAITIDPKRCWVANENRANQIYEPYILQNIKDFKECTAYLQREGRKMLKEYWETSLSFEDNLKIRVDKKQGYDAEVLIAHPIKPADIQVKYIISDHRMLSVEGWKKIFCDGCTPESIG